MSSVPLPEPGPVAPVMDSRERLPCPLCDYDLRGQIEPRCPECGYRFDWEELRDPARRRHRYLFEHHPERNVRSFFATLIGGLRPRRFWAELYPTQPSRPGRLFVYFIVIALSSILGAASIFGEQLAGDYGMILRQRAGMLAAMNSPQYAPLRRRYPGLTPQQVVDQFLAKPTLRRLARDLWWSWKINAMAMVALWPVVSVVLTGMTMMVFRISMRRARVRPIHGLRCVIYSGDVVFWVNLLLMLGLAWLAVMDIGGITNARPDPILHGGVWAAVCAACWLIFCYRLIVALKKYMRLDHAFLTVLATQIIVALAVLAMAINIAQIY